MKEGKNHPVHFIVPNISYGLFSSNCSTDPFFFSDMQNTKLGILPLKNLPMHFTVVS